MNGFRTAKTAKAKALVTEVIEQAEALEKRLQVRRRARRPSDRLTFLRQIEGVISDLALRHLTDPGVGVSVSFSNRILGAKDRYRPSVMTKTLPDVVRLLASPTLALVDLELGSSNPVDRRQNRQTTLWVGDRLQELISQHQLETKDFGRDKAEEVIILKATKTGYFDSGNWIQYEDTEQTKGYREHLYHLNAWLEQADIAFIPLEGMDQVVDTSDRRLLRYFNNGNFTEGGRLFGGFWQTLSKSQRRRGILIDGEPVMTLDFGQMAPRMLYGGAGIDLPFEDAYCIPGYEDYRAGVKKMFNAMLHSTKELDRLPKGTKALLPRRCKVKDVVDAILSVHGSISYCFHRGLGMYLQYRESEILLEVLGRLRGRNITALPIHDAVVVRVNHEDDVREVMLEVFLEKAGIEGMVTLDG